MGIAGKSHEALRRAIENTPKSYEGINRAVGRTQAMPKGAAAIRRKRLMHGEYFMGWCCENEGLSVDVTYELHRIVDSTTNQFDSQSQGTMPFHPLK